MQQGRRSPLRPFVGDISTLKGLLSETQKSVSLSPRFDLQGRSFDEEFSETLENPYITGLVTIEVLRDLGQ